MDPEIRTGKGSEIRYTEPLWENSIPQLVIRKVVQELLKEEKSLAQIASEYEVHPTQLKNWRTIAIEGLPSLFEKQDSTAEMKEAYEQQLTDLYAEIGKLTT